ncbi:MAG TPA: hypothetical protein ENI26_08700 [Methylophaga aminisulfidivorans]|uniref:O-antigen ligase-related domain-containing protein n=3 Tax=root TaxID=1 RepID=A0A7C1W142_9GAMM|nr:hypothetical protein [Methylophaga aminisulfidivorans]
MQRFVASKESIGLLMLALMPTVFLFSRALADITIVILGALFLYKCYLYKDWQWASTGWFVMSMIITAYISFIVPIGAEFSLSAFTGGLSYYRWPLFAAAMCFWILTTEKRFFAFELGVFVLLIFIVVDTVIQYFTGSDMFGYKPIGVRLTGPFNKLIPGTFSLRIIFIAVSFIYFSQYITNERVRVISVISALFIGLIFIFLTGERGAFLSMFLGSIIIVISLFIVLKRQRKFLLLFTLIFFILSSFFAFSQQKIINRTFISSYHYIIDWKDSASAKVIVPAIGIWQENNSLTGIGVKNYSDVCRQDKYEHYGSLIDRNCYHPHNIYVQWLVEAGVIGFLLFLVFLVFVIRDFFRYSWFSPQRLVGIFAFCVFLTTFWPIMGSMSFFHNSIASIIWLSLSWSLAKTRKEYL